MTMDVHDPGDEPPEPRWVDRLLWVAVAIALAGIGGGLWL